MRFEFTTAGRILFGAGALKEAAPVVRSLGTCALVVTGGNPRRADRLLELLAAESVETVLFPVPAEPTVELATAGAELARREGCNVVVGFGGGSPIDASKAIAAFTTNRGDPLDHLEVIGRARPLEAPPLPVVAIPTTAGTGAEVTRNAVLASPAHRVKVSLRHPGLLPRAAVVDPELTVDLPPALTASTGMDALTQLIEPFVSCRANPLTDAICREGLRRVSRSLLRAFQDGQDLAAREDMCLASLFGGMALANAGLGAVHGFAGPIGGMFSAPHGAVCAALLAPVMTVNLAALRARESSHPALERFVEIAALLTGEATAPPDAAVEWIQGLCRELRIPPLTAHGVTSADHAVLVEKALAASSTKGNPLPITREELGRVLEKAG